MFVHLICDSISDDDEVPPLSSKFGDIYPVGSYEGNGMVTAAVNGLKTINGDGQSMALKAVVSGKNGPRLAVNFPC